MTALQGRIITRRIQAPRVATRPNSANVTASRPSDSRVLEPPFILHLYFDSVLRHPSQRETGPSPSHRSLSLKGHPLQQHMTSRPTLATLCPRPASGMGTQQGGQGGPSKGRVKDTSLKPLRVAEWLRGGHQHGEPYVSGSYISR
jgi:hypothetical protein